MYIAHLEHPAVTGMLGYDRDFDRIAGMRQTEPNAYRSGFRAPFRAALPISDCFVLEPP